MHAPQPVQVPPSTTDCSFSKIVMAKWLALIASSVWPGWKLSKVLDVSERGTAAQDVDPNSKVKS